MVATTMARIEPKLIKCRILATTPPTNKLHRATLVTTALIPVYNHVLWPCLWNPIILRTSSLKSFDFSGSSKWMNVRHRRGDW
jgi:hypothetical protein